MKKVIVIGCPGSGKSVFSRELHEITGLPLYPLDMIRWRADRTIVPREQMIDRIMEIAATDEWIIDGNYGSTMELRMSCCDTIIFLDYPTEVCYDGIMRRRGTVRPDMPWVEPRDEVDPEFLNTVLQYNTVNRPVVLERIQKYTDGREIHIFQSRAEATKFLNVLRKVVEERFTMKMIFIGTSHGVPEADRRCSSCILEVNGFYYLVDMGTQVVEDLRRRGIAIDSVRLAICTHSHGDHTDGLISFVDLVNWYFKTADPLILLPDSRLIPPLRAWLTATTDGKPLREDLRIASFGEGVAYEDENLRVTAIKTKHCENSFAFLIEAEGKKVLFTGDLCHPSVDFPQVAFETELELIVCETAHFSPDDCVSCFDKTKAKRVLHTHVNDQRWGDALSRQSAVKHPYEYGAAFDGMELSL